MTSAEVRRVFGKTVAYSPSDFLNEVPMQLKEYVGGKSFSSQNSYMNTNRFNTNGFGNNSVRPIGQGAVNYNISSVAATSNNISQGMLSEKEATLGRKVKHLKFGVGTIVNVSKDGSDIKLTIAFDTQGIKSFMLNVAPLELL